MFPIIAFLFLFTWDLSQAFAIHEQNPISPSTQSNQSENTSSGLGNPFMGLPSEPTPPQVQTDDIRTQRESQSDQLGEVSSNQTTGSNTYKDTNYDFTIQYPIDWRRLETW
jgi:hypothetical protein